MENLLYWCCVITTICGAVTTAFNVFKLVKTPKDALDSRIARIEERLALHDVLLDKDNKRIQQIEEGNIVTQRALLALLSNAIDGNNKDDLVEARKELQDYLIKR